MLLGGGGGEERNGRRETTTTRGSHRGRYKRDKLSRFFLSLRLPHGREYKQVFPERISHGRSSTATIENLRQFRRASVYPREKRATVGARRRESRGKMAVKKEGKRRRGEKGRPRKWRKVPKRCLALVAAQFRVKTLFYG